jgi:hypothetical protein
MAIGPIPNSLVRLTVQRRVIAKNAAGPATAPLGGGTQLRLGGALLPSGTQLSLLFWARIGPGSMALLRFVMIELKGGSHCNCPCYKSDPQLIGVEFPHCGVAAGT